MDISSFHYIPVGVPFFLGLPVLLGLVIFFIEIGIIEYAYHRIGVKRRYALGLLLLSLLGSYVNMPPGKLPSETILSRQEVPFFEYDMSSPW